MSTFNEDAAAYARMKRKNTRVQSYAKEHATRTKAAMEALIERGEEEKIGGVKLKGLANVVIKEPTWYATMQDRRVFQIWAAANRKGLLRVTEEEKLLNELVREYRRDHKALPPGLGAYPRKSVSVTKA